MLKNSRDEITDPICTMTLYVAAVRALFLTSNVFSEIHADTIGWKYGYPEIRVVIVKRGQLYPPFGRAINAASRGRDHSSPKRQWKVRSLKISLLLQRASMRMICSAAEGIESMFESKVENPRRLRVRER